MEELFDLRLAEPITPLNFIINKLWNPDVASYFVSATVDQALWSAFDLVKF
jgi:hypothetical protein